MDLTTHDIVHHSSFSNINFDFKKVSSYSIGCDLDKMSQRHITLAPSSEEYFNK